MTRFAGISVVVCALLIMGGCPQADPAPQPSGDTSAPPSRPPTIIQPSTISAGTYVGELTTTTIYLINGQVVNTETSTDTRSISFGADGIPLDPLSGEPEHPGRMLTRQDGDTTLSYVTETVIVAGDRITSTYKGTLSYTNFPTIGTLTLYGGEEDVFTKRADGKLDVVFSSAGSSNFLYEAMVVGIEMRTTGTLAPPGTPGGTTRDTPGGDALPTGAAYLGCPCNLNHELFTLSIPCRSMRSEPTSEIPMADYQMYFYDDQSATLYFISVVAPEFLPEFSSTSSTATNVDFRFEGSLRSASGDMVVLATGHLSGGTEYKYGYAMLANGHLLMVGTTAHNPLATSVFSSINLADTDGSELGTPRPGIPALLAPAPDAVVVLEDGAAYRVRTAAGRQRVASWQPGAQILVHDASLMSFEPFFLTNRSDWVSVEAEYIGLSTKSTIQSVTDLEYGSVEILLADGSRWEASYSDEGEARTWAAGEAVAVVDDTGSFTGHTMVRLRTGRTIDVTAN